MKNLPGPGLLHEVAEGDIGNEDGGGNPQGRAEDTGCAHVDAVAKPVQPKPFAVQKTGQVVLKDRGQHEGQHNQGEGPARETPRGLKKGDHQQDDQHDPLGIQKAVEGIIENGIIIEDDEARADKSGGMKKRSYQARRPSRYRRLGYAGVNEKYAEHQADGPMLSGREKETEPRQGATGDEKLVQSGKPARPGQFL